MDRVSDPPSRAPASPPLLRFGEIEVVLLRKKVRNLHLRVSPPDGRVTLSAPVRMSIEAIHAFAASKLDWIRRTQVKVRSQKPAISFSFREGELHYLWGHGYPLRLVEKAGPLRVEFFTDAILLRIPPGTTAEERGRLLESWYRNVVRQAAFPLVARWEPILGVRVGGLFVRRMKSRWGSCSPHTRRIRLNSELARKPFDCFEYVVVHEMAHLLVQGHGAPFWALLDRFLPDWRTRKRRLDLFPRPPG